MSTLDTTTDVARRPFQGRRARFGDVLLQSTAGLAALGAAFLFGLIVYKIVEGARLSLSRFGIGFVTQVVWDSVHNHFGAGAFLFGTAVTSLGALLLATPLAIGIALFLSELAPGWIRGPVTALIETLAAIPSVVIGLWGLLVLVPLLANHVDPALHSALGFIPLFGSPTGGTNAFAAIVVLTIMILPIISSISRELFIGVPGELKEGALALGLTRWEMVRGVVLPYARSGVAAAMLLGLGRAIGEAIAVTQVIGGFTGTHLTWNLFYAGGWDTLGSKIAENYQGASSGFEHSSLIYLALILLVFSIVVNVLAQVIVRRGARKLGRTA